jgi:hypothetical protein
VQRKILCGLFGAPKANVNGSTLDADLSSSKFEAITTLAMEALEPSVVRSSLSRIWEVAR